MWKQEHEFHYTFPLPRFEQPALVVCNDSSVIFTYAKREDHIFLLCWWVTTTQWWYFASGYIKGFHTAIAYTEELWTVISPLLNIIKY